MPRTCIFCGTSGQLTEEHVLPSELEECLPGVGRFVYVRHPDPKGGGDIRIWDADGLNHTIERVCYPCNHDWLADLQNLAVKVAACSMAKGQPVSLSEPEQETLALWLTTRAMVADYAHAPPHRGFTFEERDAVRRDGTIPDTIVFWLAAYKGPRTFFYRLHDLALYPPSEVGRDGSTDFNSQWVTFVIGRLAVRLWKMPEPAHRSLLTEHLGSISDSIRIPWPIQSDILDWPPMLWLDDPGLDDFSMYLIPELHQP